MEPMGFGDLNVKFLVTELQTTNSCTITMNNTYIEHKMTFFRSRHIQHDSMYEILIISQFSLSCVIVQEAIFVFGDSQKYIALHTLHSNM